MLVNGGQRGDVCGFFVGFSFAVPTGTSALPGTGNFRAKACVFVLHGDKSAKIPSCGRFWDLLADFETIKCFRCADFHAFFGRSATLRPNGTPTHNKPSRSLRN